MIAIPTRFLLAKVGGVKSLVSKVYDYHNRWGIPEKNRRSMNFDLDVQRPQ